MPVVRPRMLLRINPSHILLNLLLKRQVATPTTTTSSDAAAGFTAADAHRAAALEYSRLGQETRRTKRSHRGRVRPDADRSHASLGPGRRGAGGGRTSSGASASAVWPIGDLVKPPMKPSVLYNQTTV